MDRFSGSFKDFLGLLKLKLYNNCDETNNENIGNNNNENIGNNCIGTNLIEVKIDFLYESHSIHFSLN